MSKFADSDIGFISVNKGICNRCQHRGHDPMTCKAFPTGIPEEILRGDFDHHKPFEGDKDIQFEPTPSI